MANIVEHSIPSHFIIMILLTEKRCKISPFLESCRSISDSDVIVTT